MKETKLLPILQRAYSAHRSIQRGWHEYQQYFYIPVASAIITNYLGIPTGMASLAFGFLLFWWLGHTHSRLEKYIKSKEVEK